MRRHILFLVLFGCVPVDRSPSSATVPDEEKMEDRNTSSSEWPVLSAEENLLPDDLMALILESCPMVPLDHPIEDVATQCTCAAFLHDWSAYNKLQCNAALGVNASSIDEASRLAKARLEQGVAR